MTTKDKAEQTKDTILYILKEKGDMTSRDLYDILFRYNCFFAARYGSTPMSEYFIEYAEGIIYPKIIDQCIFQDNGAYPMPDSVREEYKALIDAVEVYDAVMIRALEEPDEENFSDAMLEVLDDVLQGRMPTLKPGKEKEPVTDGDMALRGHGDATKALLANSMFDTIKELDTEWPKEMTEAISYGVEIVYGVKI